jgi:[ribosomal protein S5]-alanine N-acetyltransferase
VGLTDANWRDRRAEVGYWVAASRRRRGLAGTAVRLLSTWALAHAGFERLDLYANPANEASQRVAETAGFTREGLLRKLRYRQGEREDLYLFSRLAQDL